MHEALSDFLRRNQLAEFIFFLAHFARHARSETMTSDSAYEVTATHVLVDEKTYERWRKTAAKEIDSNQQFLQECDALWVTLGMLEIDGRTTRLRRETRSLGYLIDYLFPISQPALRADARYFAMLDIRRSFDIALTGETARHFHLLAESFPKMRPPEGDGKSVRLPDLRRHFRRILAQAASDIQTNDAKRRKIHRFVDGFMELCLFQRLLSTVRQSKDRALYPRQAQDGEFLISQMFGLPTPVRGLDNLFGGGGPLFGDNYLFQGGGGRTLLLSGHYGTGKTTLAMSLAAAVARKGGLAWIIPLEQSSKDCRYYFETLNLLGELNRPDFSISSAEVTQALPMGPASGRGLISLLEHKPGSIEMRLKNILYREEQTRKAWPLRLIVLDPVNAFCDYGSTQSSDIRALLTDTFNTLKENAMNLVLVAENDGSNVVQHLHSTADTVLQLTTEATLNYKQRFIEIEKNRLQREHRGRHPFSIKPGEGLAIFPSPASIGATERYRHVPSGREPVEFGWPQFDAVLGTSAIYPGDVLVFSGDSGTSKTDIGLLFSLSANDPSPASQACSLIIPLRETTDSILRLLDPLYKHSGTAFKDPSAQIIIREGLATGYIQPGRIMQAIKEAFESVGPARQIDRVFIDDANLWDLNCPFVAAESTFIETLIQFLRNKGALILFSLPTLHTRDSNVQRSILNAANVHIHFQMIDFRGSRRPVLRVVKSRSHSAKRELIDIHCTDGRLTLGEESSLLRVSHSGAVTVIPSVLIVHQESRVQRDYNHYIKEALGQHFGDKVELQEGDRTGTTWLTDLQRFSTVERLQIQQVDEFQMGELLRDGAKNLRTYKSQDVGDNIVNSWSQEDRRKLVTEERVHGFPYLDNRARLFYQTTLDKNAVSSWYSLERACLAWEKKYASGFFFAFDNRIVETYNVLLLEIFLGIGGVLPRDLKSLRKWPASNEFRTALRIMVTLCSRWEQRLHSAGGNGPSAISAPDRSVKTSETPPCNPVVWRVWFSSIASGDIADAIRPLEGYNDTNLPNDVAVSGEWYLVVPQQSAAVRAALEMVKALIDRDQQLERLDRGVGLPVSKDFLDEDRRPDIHSYLRDFNQGFRNLRSDNDEIFYRSSIPHYAKFHGVLGKHVRSALSAGGKLKRKALDSIAEVIQGDIKFAIAGIADSSDGMVRSHERIQL